MRFKAKLVFAEKMSIHFVFEFLHQKYAFHNNKI